MKISIITATYNSGTTLADCLQSVNEQTYPDIEHIIIDGGSADNTLEVIKSCPNRVTKIVSEPDKGIYDAMNKGIGLATGDIVGILNSDDFYSDGNVISDVISLFNSGKVDAIYADLDVIDKNNLNHIKRKCRSGEYRHNAFKWGWMPTHPTFFVRKHIYDTYGCFLLNFKTSADYELMLRFIHKFRIEIAYLPRVIVKMRSGGLSDSSIRHRLYANKEDRLAWKTNGLKPYFFTTFLKPFRKIGQYL